MKDWLSDSELLRTVLDCLPIGVYILDRGRRVRFWNRAAEQITGYLTQDIVGQTCSRPLEHCDQDGQVLCDGRCPSATALHTGKQRQNYVFSLHKQGHRVGVRIHTIPLFHGEESAIGVLVAFDERPDWTVLEANTSQVSSCLDSMTGIPAHRFTRAVLNEYLADPRQFPNGFGLLRIRLEGLDRLRSKHGPQSATPFLRTAAQTLRHALQPDSFLGRWGEDEFLATASTASPMRIAAIAGTLRNLIRKSEVSWWGDRLSPSADVAYAIARAGDSLEKLLGEMNASPGKAPVGL